MRHIKIKAEIISEEKAELEKRIEKLQRRIDNWYPDSFESFFEYDEMLIELEEMQVELESLSR